MDEQFAGAALREAPARDGTILRCSARGSGIAIIAPLPFGMSLEGLKDAAGERGFYEALGSGDELVLYDQRDPDPGQASEEAWEQRAADLWSVADASNIERAVLYGVFDAGQTVVRAALQQPERVLGVVLNAVPPSFPEDLAGGAPGVAVRSVRDCCALVLQGLGVEARESLELAAAWESEHHRAPGASIQMLRSAGLDSLAGELRGRILILEPRTCPMAGGWGKQLAELIGDARLLRPARSGEVLGAVHSFLAQIDIEEGRQASSLTAEQSAAIGESEHSVAALRRILVPVGDDLSSERAAAMACRLGAPQQAEVVLVHVAEIPLTRTLQDLYPEERERGERALRIGRAIVANRGLACRTRLLTERSASSGILRAASEENADLIVMAMREKRRGMPSDLSLTMRGVLRNAPCEVLIDQAQAVAQ
jgi:nucleotide-binding universal stress UspA family protein/pimeloyl-ACP methyl ester carboxylesterase